RAHSLQSPRAPVHANEIDALRPGAYRIRPNVEKITIRRTLRATREPDEADRRCGQEVAARQVARMGHHAGRDSYSAVEPSRSAGRARPRSGHPPHARP